MIEGQISHQKSELKQVKAKVDVGFTSNSLPEEHIPSYVGVSCAVSGYRTLNKYDAVIREGFYSHGSPTRIALSRGHDTKSPPLTSPDDAKEGDSNSNNIAAVNLREHQHKFPTTFSGEIMDSPQRSINGHPSNHYSRVIKVEHITSVDGTTSSSHYAEKGLAQCGTGREGDGKSFVQQRIERLYGPAALGMAFQAKRAMLERYKEREKETGDEGDSLSQVFRDPPHGLPSVFRHLRPEFRHQLPVKPKGNISWRSKSSSIEKEEAVGSSSSALTNGHRVRHIPIELEKDDTDSSSKDSGNSPTEKSWKTLSRDLQAINGSNLISPTKNTVNISSSLKTLDLNKNINSSSESKSAPIPSQTITKDGHYFLQVVADEVASLEPKIAKVEGYLKTADDEMTEEVKGKLLAASGKAKLLISQKVEQFKGLCQNNITKSTTEEFPTTNEDLAGFWDMVSIQVEAVKDLLNEVEVLRKNNWKEQTKVVSSEVKKPANRKLKSGGTAGQKSTPPVKDAAKQKADEERRRQMREALNAKRRQASKLKNANKESEVEIFIPEK